MNNYDKSERGTFQNFDYAKQLVSFEGMKFEGRNGFYNVTPTDIDGLIQLDSLNCFIFFELKHSGGVPTGQANALQKLCDVINQSRAEGVIFVAIHNTEYPITIIAKDAKVKSIYWKGKWYQQKRNITLYEQINNYLIWKKKQIKK